MIVSRDSKELLPAVEEKLKLFKDLCKKNGIDVLITSTYRDNESQDALYAQGRTKPGHIVTHLMGGQSEHNKRTAFDFVPIVNGKAIWNDTALFVACGRYAESVGLEWGGSWKTFKDMPHCQDTKARL